ncbi:MAG: outer membrane protein assembly factor BamA [Deltaproteobacteria bacterium]|jgi:outer membrane protein insertion porin family|nr:outer membrane protein assembly factor BamA [Deltaproteobacteria bacterium]
MRTHVLSLFFLFCAGLLTACPTHAAQAAQSPLVLVLPFQINAGEDMAYLNAELPQMVSRRLASKGFRVVPADRARAMAQGKDSQDPGAARALAAAAGADYAVCGVFNQLGETFSLESRLLPVRSEGGAQPLTAQGQGIINLGPAVDKLTDQMAGTVAANRNVREPLVASGAGSLADVQVRGMKVLDPDVVLMRLRLRRGDSPNPVSIDEDVKRVWDMGYFSDVRASLEQQAAGRVLVFTVEEKPRIDNVVVNGAGKIDKEDIIGAMSTKTGSVLNEKLLAEDLQKITDLYRAQGYYLAKVTSSVDPRPTGSGAVLTLNVEEGGKLYIREVRIDGLKGMKQGDMKDYMALKERNILSWFTGSGVLKDEYLERDATAIAAYALNQGYVDVQVAPPVVDYKPDGIHIVFTVDEGPRYKLGDILFIGDLIDTEARLLEVIKLNSHKKEETYFSLSVMQEDTKRLTEFYGDHGYAFAEVDTKVERLEDGHILNVAYAIQKKQKVYIRRVNIEGNMKTRDNVILREMRLADGDVYDGAKLRRSNERLSRLRYFTQMNTELVPTGVDDEVDLKINLKEDNTGAVMAGIGYSTYYDVGFTASIMERNLFGRGYWAQLQGFFSWRRTSGTLSFTNPRLWDTELAVGGDLYYIHDTWDDFTKETVGSTIRMAHPIGEYTSIGWGYRLEQYTLSDIHPWSSALIRDYRGTNWTSAVNARIVRDTTDDRARPTKGTITSISGEYGGGGLGGDDNFVKALADWHGFYSWRPEHTIHLRGRLGGVFQNTNKNVPIFDRFYLGGIDTIRGFSYTDLSPRDKRSWEHIGGDRMGVVNIEYIWMFQKDLGLAIAPFVDGGFNIDSKSKRMRTINDDTWVWSSGLELRWRSPMGDLRLAYGWPLTKNYNREWKPGRFEFTMGSFF